MPNWCLTSYAIEGSREDLDCINKAICDVLDGKFKKQKDSAQEWEGNVLHALRIPTEVNGSSIGYFRGFIYDKPEFDEGPNGTCLRFYAEEAWSRTDFAEALQIRFKNITVYFSAEESGCDYYVTNDVGCNYFSRIMVEFVVDGCCDNEYFEDEGEALRYLRDRIGIGSLEEIQEYNDKHEEEDEYIYFHVFDTNDCGGYLPDVPLMKPEGSNLF